MPRAKKPNPDQFSFDFEAGKDRPTEATNVPSDCNGPAASSLERAIKHEHRLTEAANRRDRFRRRKPVEVAQLRAAELHRLREARYGGVYPDDDAGLEELMLFARQVVCVRDNPLPILRSVAPWVSDDELDEIVRRARVSGRGSASSIGMKLRLTEDERRTLKIKTIRAWTQSSDEDMARSRTAQKRSNDERRRRRRGQVRREEYLKNSKARWKPWERRGMSRATYYRKGLHRRRIEWVMHLYSQSNTNVGPEDKKSCDFLKNKKFVNNKLIYARSAGGC